MQLDHLNHKIVLEGLNVYNPCLTPIAKLLRSFDCGWKTPKGVKMISRMDVHYEEDLKITTFKAIRSW